MADLLQDVRAGFMPLVDCAPLAVAAELGFAEDEGIGLILSRETSWATIRDRLVVGQLDAAHCLAPMPIAANLGLGPLTVPMVVPMALGTGANTVTVSVALAGQMALGPVGGFDAAAAIKALGAAVGERRKKELEPLVFGIVHPFSAHRYELAYWLASGGLMPGRDVEFVVVPPSLMPSALKSEKIDGFCAGEPWGTVATASGAGCIVTTNAHIWRNSPEKVLGVRQAWADECGDVLTRLIRALHKSAEWCDRPENTEALTLLLARQDYVGQPMEQLRPSLSRVLQDAIGSPQNVADFLSFSRKAATFPWVSHALWFYSQMVRWGQATHSDAALQAARGTYRPDLYRAALSPLGIEVPGANSKVEGALLRETPAGSRLGQLQLGPDVFFDGGVFDPDQFDNYLRSFE